MLTPSGMVRTHNGKFHVLAQVEELESATVQRGSPLAADVHVKLFAFGKLYLVMEFFGDDCAPSTFGPEVCPSVAAGRHALKSKVKRAQAQAAVVAAMCMCDVLLSSLPADMLNKDVQRLRDLTANCKEDLRKGAYLAAAAYAVGAEKVCRSGLDKTWRNPYEELVKVTADVVKLHKS